MKDVSVRRRLKYLAKYCISITNVYVRVSMIRTNPAYRVMIALAYAIIATIISIYPYTCHAQQIKCEKMGFIRGWSHPYNLIGHGMLSMDVNRDGILDIIASANRSGRSFVYLGMRGVFDTTADIILPYGDSEMSKGDYNGDGLQDIAIHSYSHYEDRDTGRAYIWDMIYVFMGREDSPYAIDTVPSFTLTNSMRRDVYDWGEIIESGDVDGDGRDELIVATQRTDRYAVFPHQLCAVSIWDVTDMVPAGELIDVRVADTTTNYNYELRRLKVGDVNADGICDLIFGMQVRDTISRIVQMPQICVLNGRKNSVIVGGKYDQVFNADSLWPGYRFTYPPIFNIEYANSDSVADFFWNPAEGNYYGDSLHVMYGNAIGLSGKSDQIIVNPDPRNWHGSYPIVHRIGDYNGDGYRDYAIGWGASPCVAMIVYLGNKWGLSNEAKAVCFSCGETYGRQYVCIGDVNGDGADDHCVSDPYPWDWPDDPNGKGFIMAMPGSKRAVLDIEEMPADGSDMETGLEVSVHPVPASNRITVHINAAASGSYSLHICSLDGDVRLSKTIELQVGENVLYYDSSIFAGSTGAGVYVLQIVGPTAYAAKKFIVQM
jgi:hypothetical protein